MMRDVKVIFVTSRKFTFEMEGFGKYYSEEEYEIFLNGVSRGTNDRTVVSIGGLKPDTRYELSL